VTTTVSHVKPELGAWQLPEELQMLRQTVAEFMAKDVRPAEEELDFDAYQLPADVLGRLQAKARKAGLWCVKSPAEYGGAGLSILAQCVVAEEAAKCRMGAYVPACGAFGWDPPGLIFEGTQEQIQRWAIPTIESGKPVFVAITEPSGGSDPAHTMQTKARLVGGKWVINGTKIFITRSLEAEWGIVFARTEPAEGAAGISAFIVETSSPGLTRRPIPVIRAWSPGEVHFEDVEVPAENLIGGRGRAFELSRPHTVPGRVPYTLAGVGIAQAALGMAIDHAKNRETTGGLLASKQAIQMMIADSEIELRAARLLCYEAAWKADLGLDCKTEAAIAKVYATEAASRVVDRSIQILGGLGLCKEMPTERWYRELRVRRIGEGPNELHRLTVASAMLSGATAVDGLGRP